MRASFLACVLFSCLGLATADSSTTTELLWPLPRSAQFGSTVYSLNPETFTFVGTGPGATTPGDSSNSLKDAFERYTNLIFQTPAPFFPSGGSSGAAQQELTSLEVNVMSDNVTLGLDTNETCMELPGYIIVVVDLYNLQTVTAGNSSLAKQPYFIIFFIFFVSGGGSREEASSARLDAVM